MVPLGQAYQRYKINFSRFEFAGRNVLFSVVVGLDFDCFYVRMRVPACVFCSVTLTQFQYGAT